MKTPHHHIINVMIEKRIERYKAILMDFEKQGINNLSFLDGYILFCDHGYCSAQPLSDDVIKGLERRIHDQIFHATDDEILSFLQEIKLTEDITSFKFADILFNCKRYESFMETTVEKIVVEDLIPLSDILKNQNFVKCFVQAIKRCLLSIDYAVTFWINKYDRGSVYCLPKMDDSEIEILITNFISSEARNPADLSLLINHKNSRDSYVVSPPLRDKLRKAFDECLNDPSVVLFKVPDQKLEVGFDEQMIQPYFEGFQSNHYRMVSSLSFVDSHIDLSGLRYTLCYALRLFDDTDRMIDIYNPFLDSSLSAAFEHRTIEQYGGERFREREALKIDHFRVVGDHLQKINAPIESRLMEIVKSISTKSGNTCGFKISLYANHAAISRAESVFNEIESLAKQYYVLKQFGSLTDQFYRDTMFPGFEALKSKDPRNYLEPSLNPKTKAILFALFHDRPYFPNHREENEGYFNLFGAIRDMRFKRDDFSYLDKERITLLVDEGLLSLRDDGVITFSDVLQIRVLTEIFNNLFVSGRYISKTFHEAVNGLVNKDILRWTDGLLSNQEIEFFNYYMTDKRPRAASLRNKYQHGASFSVDDEEATRDYYAGLRLLCVLVYKIKDEIEDWD